MIIAKVIFYLNKFYVILNFSESQINGPLLTFIRGIILDLGKNVPFSAKIITISLQLIFTASQVNIRPTRTTNQV
jgi:hypothetical protein